MVQSGYSVQCQVSEDGMVEVQLASERVRLSEEHLARSPVLSSIADKLGTSSIPLSEEAFTLWHVYEDTLQGQSITDTKVVLQVRVPRKTRANSILFQANASCSISTPRELHFWLPVHLTVVLEQTGA